MFLFTHGNAQYEAEARDKQVDIARTVRTCVEHPEQRVTIHHYLTFPKLVYKISVNDSENTLNVTLADGQRDSYSFGEIESVFIGEDKQVEQNNDNVNHPAHYQSKSGLETIDVIEAFTEGLTGIEAVCTGNALKYLCRWKHKNGVEDLKKATWYIRRLIDIKEANK